MINRFSVEFLFGVGTGGLSTVSKVGWVGKVGKGVFLWDTLGNGAAMIRGGSDIAENGFTWQNSIQFFGGTFGLAGNWVGRTHFFDDVPVAPVPKSGPGRFERVIESMPDRAARYQSRITGRLPDVGYRVNGVKFDGFDEIAGVLLDAKGPGYAKFVRNGEFQPWFRGADELVEQAQRQLGVRAGLRIQWHFAEEAAAEATRNLFRFENIEGIEIIFTP